MTRRRALAIAFVLIGLTAAAIVAAPYVHGLSFVIRAAGIEGTARRIADLDAGPYRERELMMSTRRGPARARLYEPADGFDRVALLVTGLHPTAIDEPRLVGLARELAASGVAVVIPEIPELARFEITPAITDAIEDSAAWLATASGLASDGRIGMMGISFSGGLSIVAAARPSLAGRVAYVFSFGGHHDLPRVLRYLCTGAAPYPPGQIALKADPASASGEMFVRPPHDYGIAVVLLALADRVVPATQVARLRDGVRRFLNASALDDNDEQKAQAAAEFEAVRTMTRTLPEPSRTLLRYVVERDVVHLGARLLPYVSSYGDDPALSVSRSAKPAVPLFLLHGIEDNVIPPIELEYLAADLRGGAPVRALLSGLISHAAADRPLRIADVMELAGFGGDLLRR
jgi:dienelactone hydrolase